MSKIARAAVCAAAVVALIGGAAVHRVQAAGAGPVAAYGFNEGGGTVLHDSSGNANDGMISGASWTSGKYGGALSFNGSNSMVTVPSSAGLKPADAVTIEAWVWPQTVSSWRAAVVKEQSSSALSYGLYPASSAGATGIVYTTAEQQARSGSVLPVNTWSYVAAVYNDTSVQVYVNGRLAAQRATSGPIAETDRPLRLGGDSIWNEWFYGKLDEVRIYGRALTSSEIQADATTPVGSSTASDTAPPSAPTGLAKSSATATSVSLSWGPSSDNVGVAGYDVFLGSAARGTSTSTSYTVSGLACGTSYTFAVDAYDAAGNHSAKATAVASTSACPPPADAQAPSVPSGVVVGGSTQSGVSLSWSASSDNVGVAGYGVYVGSSLVGSTASTSYAVSGLSCGTSYTFSVDAFDGAGNRSGKASVSASTAACSGGGSVGLANIFISPSGGGCKRFASPVSFAQAGAANACGPSSWGQACLLAQSGDTVIVEDGSYPGQDFTTCTGHQNYSANVVFKTEPGHECPTYWPTVPAVGTDMSCPVSVNDLNLRNQYSNGGNCPGGGTGHYLPSTLSDFSQWLNHLEFHDMYVAGFTTRCVRYLVFQNVDGQNWFLRSAYHVQFLGGSYGNQFTGDCPQIGNFVGPDAPVTQDVLVAKVIFHDQRHDNSPTTHPDGLFVQDSDHVTITQSIFVRDDVIPLYVNGFGGYGVSNLTITNNLIHTPTNHVSGYPSTGAASSSGGNSLNLGDYPLSNVVVSFNSIEGPIYRHGPGCNGNADPTNSNVAIYGNISSGLNGDCNGNCKPSIAYAYNVIYNNGSTCAPSDVSAAAGYTSRDVLDAENIYGDYSLAAGAAAIALVPSSWCSAHPGACPSSDFNGASRPSTNHTASTNAGAYENR